MSRRVIVAAVVSCVVLGAVSARAADRVKAGLWETTMKLNGAAAPMVSSYCITADEAKLMNGDAATVKKYVEESTAKKTNGRCTAKSVVVQANRTVVTLACGKTEIVGTTAYFGDRYESSTSDGTKLTGRRTGACKP